MLHPSESEPLQCYAEATPKEHYKDQLILDLCDQGVSEFMQVTCTIGIRKELPVFRYKNSINCKFIRVQDTA